jgi:ABC-type branched-subunit amino acid transport system substrate-binding protein
MPVGRLFLKVERPMENRVAHFSRLREISFLLVATSFATCSSVCAQTDGPATKPYATLDRQSVTYRGPVGTTGKELPAGAAVIGMIVPLRGPQEPEGKALLAAAQIALEEEQSQGTLPDGRELALAVRDESGPWGQASSEILKLIEQDHAAVLLTSANGATAHQAEQIANKISFPILTFASDPTTTETNVPWLFRLGPSDTDQARAFCQRIYAQLGFKKVLLISQTGHDGRIGWEEFEKAARDLKVRRPAHLEIANSAANLEAIRNTLLAESPDAIVVWADAALAEPLLSVIRKAQPSAPVFLCRKAAQMGVVGKSANDLDFRSSGLPHPGGIFIVDSLQVGSEAAESSFPQLFRARTGASPSIAANQAYEAVRLIAAALRGAGANRVLLRNYFANEGKLPGAPSLMPFDPAGNSVETFGVVELLAVSIPATTAANHPAVP